MLKRLFIFFVIFFLFFLFLNIIYAEDVSSTSSDFSESTADSTGEVFMPSVVCDGLPGCDKDTDLGNEKKLGNKEDFSFIVNIIRELIKYVSLIAVISVMIAGIMYMVSFGNDDKVEKVKKWLIWSLLGVLLSVSAWSIINLLNKFNVN